MTEKDRDNDGQPENALQEFLNEPSDSHAMAHGVFKGFMRVSPKPQEPESIQEPHYFQTGYVLGYVLKVLVLIAAAKYGVPLL